MKTVSSDDDVDDISNKYVDCGRIEIYKDEYVSVYYGLTIWWGKKQGSQGAHCTLCIAHYIYTFSITHYTSCIAIYT